MSERLLVLEPRANLLDIAKDSETLDSPLYLVLVRLGAYAIDLTENPIGELEAVEKLDIDFDKLEILQGRFLIDKINRSMAITVTDDGTLPKIAPEHIVRGNCSIGTDPFPKPAILHIPSTEKYASHVEIYDPSTEYLYSTEKDD
jgi:hypothetical protein